MKENTRNNLKDIHLLSQPLCTEDGFLNSACMKELNAVIKDIPPTHERLQYDDEWNKKECVHKKAILGAIAKHAIRQSPICIPVGLENVLNYLNACLSREVEWDAYGFAHLSLCDINKLLHEILMDTGVEDFDNWNKSRAELDGESGGEIQFISAYTFPDPHHDFIDLHALLRNTCIDICDEWNLKKTFKEKHSQYRKLSEKEVDEWKRE